MFSGQDFRCFIWIFIFGHGSVGAARLGLQPSASFFVEDNHQATRPWEDPCQKYHAMTVENGTWLQWQVCKCPNHLPFPSEGCGTFGFDCTFTLKGVDPSCKCEEDKCETYGARRMFKDRQWTQLCQCTVNSPFPSQGCGVESGQPISRADPVTFAVTKADPTCQCRDEKAEAKARSSPVQVSSLKFCTALLEQTVRVDSVEHLWKWYAINHFQHKDFLIKKLHVTPELCREVLTGVAPTGWYSEAAELSAHPGAKGYGHLDPLLNDVKDVNASAQSPHRHHHLLRHVCQDECQEIVKETIENIDTMRSNDVEKHAMPFEQTCADRVVRKVEAEILGCCGRACGFNGRSCVSWPFFSEDEKISWLEECCTEFNILSGSSREMMCNSVLTTDQVQAVSKFDTKAKEGTDVGGSYIGQDPLLRWTEKGLSKFKDQLKLKTSPRPKKGDLVDSIFLEKNPNIHQEGIEKGWFTQEKMADEKDRSASFAEIGGSTCEGTMTKWKDTMQHCPRAMQMQVRNTCLRQDAGWQASAKPDAFDECQMRMIDPSVNPPTKVATPDECLKVKFTNVGEIKRRFFVYDTSDPPDGKLVLENPILCFSEPQNLRCPADEDFEGKNVREIELKPHEGFADYIYWIDLDREDSKA